LRTFSPGKALTYAVPAVLAVILGACVDNSDNPPSAAVAEPVSVSCPALDKLSTYRFTVSVDIHNPTPVPTTPPAQPASPTSSADPLAGAGNAIAQLLSDFTLTGAYVAPDRTQALLKLETDELEVRSIGDRSWVRVDDTWQDQSIDENPLLTPRTICDQVITAIAPSLRDPDPQSESLAGIAVTHYLAAQPIVAHLSPLIGTVAGEYTADIWIAEGGLWPAKLAIESTKTGSADPTFRMSMEVTDVEDPGITIEEPVR
jgi:hypothetical protein